jgi:hypothetical protein
MKTKLTFLTKLTAGDLVAMAIALWKQWALVIRRTPGFLPDLIRHPA